MVSRQGGRVLRGGALPPALLCSALGLALAFAPRRAWVASLVALAATAAALDLMPVPRAWLEAVFFGGWMSVAASAAMVHLSRGLSRGAALALSLNAGIWSGAETALAGSGADLAKALGCVLLLLPAALIVGCRAPVIVKVVSSWLIAVAILAATLQFLPVTPGYLPDHLD
jgi:hypothetical protein